MISRDEWRIATSVLPRRTVLRLVGASAIASALSACGSKGVVGEGVSGEFSGTTALGKAAAGSWTVSAPDAHFSSATITITEDGSWTGHFSPALDGQMQSSSKDASGTWSLSGGQLHIEVNGLFGSDPEVGNASNVPNTLSDESVRFSWEFNQRRPNDIQAGYDTRAKKLTLTVETGRKTQTITAVRS